MSCAVLGGIKGAKGGKPLLLLFEGGGGTYDYGIKISTIVI